MCLVVVGRTESRPAVHPVRVSTDDVQSFSAPYYTRTIRAWYGTRDNGTREEKEKRRRRRRRKDGERIDKKTKQNVQKKILRSW